MFGKKKLFTNIGTSIKISAYFAPCLGSFAFNSVYKEHKQYCTLYINAYNHNGRFPKIFQQNNNIIAKWKVNTIAQERKKDRQTERRRNNF